MDINYWIHIILSFFEEDKEKAKSKTENEEGKEKKKKKETEKESRIGYARIFKQF